MNKSQLIDKRPHVEAITEENSLLVRHAQNGDHLAMQRLYALYSKAMLNTAHRLLNNREDAEDVLQESFVSAFTNLDRYCFESTFGAWLKRIVVNNSISQLRKRKTLLRFDRIPELAEEDEEVPDRSLSNEVERLYQALHELPDGYRTVFSLFVLEGYDHQEIGQILGIGVSTSISQLSRAKKKLREELTKSRT